MLVGYSIDPSTGFCIDWLIAAKYDGFAVHVCIVSAVTFWFFALYSFSTFFRDFLK
ncbi:MAG: hypothetical protein QW744_05160 [Candidatus Bathyarchaeia archaeon]